MGDYFKDPLGNKRDRKSFKLLNNKATQNKFCSNSDTAISRATLLGVPLGRNIHCSPNSLLHYPLFTFYPHFSLLSSVLAGF